MKESGDNKMCMYVFQEETKKLRDSKNKKITVWKVYEVFSNSGSVYSLYHDIDRPRKPGLIISNFCMTNSNNIPDQVYSGIHVFLRRKSARAFRRGFNRRKLKIFRGTAEIKNLIAVGQDSSLMRSAVFTEIYISKEDFEEAKKGSFR